MRSRIQHVLIVTKVNDNQLVSLTRELTLHLMQKSPSIPRGTNNRYGTASLGRGMVVYVDSEFEASKAFDVPGLQRDHPELFEPMISNRSSSSLSSMNTPNESSTDEGPVTSGSSTPVGEGQLRYWTYKLCSNSPHLFDLVITVGYNIQRKLRVLSLLAFVSHKNIKPININSLKSTNCSSCPSLCPWLPRLLDQI